MRIETALRTIKSETQTLRRLNDMLAARVAELEDGLDRDTVERNRRAELREAYRAGYSAGHTAGRRGAEANPDPSGNTGGRTGRLIASAA